MLFQLAYPAVSPQQSNASLAADRRGRRGGFSFRGVLERSEVFGNKRLDILAQLVALDNLNLVGKTDDKAADAGEIAHVGVEEITAVGLLGDEDELKTKNISRNKNGIKIEI